MRARKAVIAAVVAAGLGAPAAHAHLDHPFGTFTATTPPSPSFNAGGEGARWELLATIPTMNPQSDLDFFTQGGQTYASVGMLGTSANGGGQMIVRLMDAQGNVAPEYVSNHPSATCVSNPSAALGLQHDVERGLDIWRFRGDGAKPSNKGKWMSGSEAQARFAADPVALADSYQLYCLAVK